MALLAVLSASDRATSVFLTLSSMVWKFSRFHLGLELVQLLLVSLLLLEHVHRSLLDRRLAWSVAHPVQLGLVDIELSVDLGDLDADGGDSLVEVVDGRGKGRLRRLGALDPKRRFIVSGDGEEKGGARFGIDSRQSARGPAGLDMTGRRNAWSAAPLSRDLAV